MPCVFHVLQFLFAEIALVISYQYFRLDTIIKTLRLIMKQKLVDGNV